MVWAFRPGRLSFWVLLYVTSVANNYLEILLILQKYFLVFLLLLVFCQSSKQQFTHVLKPTRELEINLDTHLSSQISSWVSVYKIEIDGPWCFVVNHTFLLGHNYWFLSLFQSSSCSRYLEPSFLIWVVYVSVIVFLGISTRGICTFGAFIIVFFNSVSHDIVQL